MRLVFIINSLDVGGAQHVLVTLCNGFLQRGHNVTVVTLSGTDDDFFVLPAGIARIALNVNGDSPTFFHALYNNIRRIISIRRAVLLVCPDIVISQMVSTNITTLMALSGTARPVIVIEHVDPLTQNSKKIWETLVRIVYPGAAYVVSASKGTNDYFSWLPSNKHTIIYNPVVNVKPSANQGDVLFDDRSRQHILGMGRLVAQKGFHLLIEAFAKLADRHPNWDLVIIGDGEKRAELEAQATTLELRDRIFFFGSCPNPYPTVAACELFVLSSLFEGLPSVVIGAMACGVPVVSFDCQSGPREIIRNGIDGILVPPGDVGALAAAMDRLMSNQAERMELAIRAVEVTERFGLEGIVTQWEELIQDILS